ncbi:hypothetical protein SAZ11_44765 [Streptomyces sp. FXJ1.4098]|nr:hypothetical protein [Streptomyces sp. FXJ1.4098]
MASTWGASASFGGFDALLPRLLSELPARKYRTAVLTHPNIWAGHGRWQVHAWLSKYRRRGLALVPPEVDWRAVLAAADWVVGDHGSLTSYATLMPVPIVLARFPYAEVHHASPAAALATTAPVLSPGHPWRSNFTTRPRNTGAKSTKQLPDGFPPSRGVSISTSAG